MPAHSKPGLLFISPYLPARTGHGSGMRAGMLIEAFSKIYDVSLVVPGVYARHEWWDDAAFLAATCASVERIPRERLRAAERSRARLPLRAQILVSHIHVFKLIAAPLIRDYLRIPSAQRPFCTLDLDDYESETFRRIAALAGANGAPAESERIARSARVSAYRESVYLPRFNQVYVCHEADRALLQRNHPAARVHVVPNAIRLPTAIAGRSDGLLTFLFVANLSYYPNHDAVVWFCSEVLPSIRRGARVPFRVVVVGGDGPEAVRSLAALPDVTLTGHAATLDGFYDGASICIVPIRAGGGTRIKILEAMSYGRPIVSTSAGAEGLDVRSGEHLLVRDAPADFAEGCLMLLHDAAQREALGGRGLAWVKRFHSAGAVEQAIRTSCPAGARLTHVPALVESLTMVDP